LQIEETKSRHSQCLQDNATLRLEKNDHFDKLEELNHTPEKIQKQVDISPVYTTCVNGRRRNSP
jgi:regulator of replication initiation timing